jgi:uncharacterized protein YjbI with pentapeptide repeats
VWRVALPNVEIPTALVTGSSQRPEPAGFGPLDVSWPQRRSKAGTYDEKWLNEDFPGYARDTAPDFFSTAPADQRIDDYFRGDEEFALDNMHPSRASVRGQLPGVAARVVIRRKGAADVEEVKTRLETIVFLPDASIGILVFRGTTPVVEDDAADVAFALAACEELGAPRSLDHYRTALDARLDKEKSGRLALREDDLVPLFAKGSGLAELAKAAMEPDPEADARAARLHDRTMARVRQELVDAGVDPDAALASAKVPPELAPLQALLPLPDFSDPDAMAAFEDAMVKADEATAKYLDGAAAQARADAKAAIAEARAQGIPVVDPFEPGAPGPGPPTPQAPPTLALFRDAGVEPDPAIVEKLENVDASLLEMYRATAHLQAPAGMLEGEAKERAARRVAEIHASGMAFAGLDCTRFDLSTLDLRSADFRGTLAEGADLTGANLAGADLSGAVLAHARVLNACLDGAKLEGANVGSADIEGATFAGADLRKAVFARARLRSASFVGADLGGVDWLEAQLGAIDFEGARLPGMDFLPGTDLSACRFARARLAKANFFECTVGAIDFTEADLELVTFLATKADGACFRNASMKKFHAVVECSFQGADFEGADLTGALLRGCNLRGANFTGARLDNADLSESDLTGAKLTGAQAREILLVRSNLAQADLRAANLMEAMLQKAKLHGADLSRSNLYGSNLGLVRTDTATKVQGANLKRALMLPRAR